jgi:hypothetical protein
VLLYRSGHRGSEIGLGALRFLTFAALAAYPAGALILAWSDNPIASIAGFGLIAASLVCVAGVMGASLQRIVGEQASKLDEYELKLRARAMSAAYTCLSTILVVAVLYAAIASEKGWWLPAGYDQYNGLFWGAFLYASMLPSAFLAWQVEPADVADRD